MAECLTYIVLKIKIKSMHLIVVFPRSTQCSSSVHMRLIALLKMLFHWIHTTVKLTDIVWGVDFIMNFPAVPPERIQLKFFGARVLPGRLVFGTLPR